MTINKKKSKIISNKNNKIFANCVRIPTSYTVITYGFVLSFDKNLQKDTPTNSFLI